MILMIDDASKARLDAGQELTMEDAKTIVNTTIFYVCESNRDAHISYRAQKQAKMLNVMPDHVDVLDRVYEYDKMEYTTQIYCSYLKVRINFDDFFKEVSPEVLNQFFGEGSSFLPMVSALSSFLEHSTFFKAEDADVDQAYRDYINSEELDYVPVVNAVMGLLAKDVFKNRSIFKIEKKKTPILM